MKVEWKALALVALVVLAIWGVQGSLALVQAGPKTYDECLLEEMRGQISEVGPIAQRVCRAKFPK